MKETVNKTARLTPEAYDALCALFEALGISGQRGASFSPGCEWLGQTVAGAWHETIAALEIAAGCAAGGDWDELIEAIWPQYDE